MADNSASASQLMPTPAMPSEATQAGALLCRKAIAEAETASHIPDQFLSAIGKVESGRALPSTGQLSAWPWTVDAEGQGQFYASKAEAIAAVQALQGRGVRSIDVGCLQVNLQQHPEAFASLDQAFDPQTNANFAAGLLSTLFVQTGSWPLAAAAYHSQTPTLGAPYQQRVLAAWAMPDRPAASQPRPPKIANPAGTAAAIAAPTGAAAIGTAAPGGQAVTVFTRTLREPPAAAQHGRGLDAYRKYPVALATRVRKQQE